MARCQIIFLISLSLLSSFISSSSGSSDSELFYCRDWDCEEFLSRGKTLLNYAGKTDKHLSFRQNEDIKIFSKPMNNDGPDWVGMVRNKIGLVPRTMIREDQLGKRNSIFQHLFKDLPFWSQQASGNEEQKAAVPIEKVEEVAKEQDSTKTEDDNSTVNDQPEAVSEANDTDDADDSSVEGNVEEFDLDDEPLSVEPIIDVLEPPQTTVMPDELQKQENLEPTETVDHEMPEIPEATVIHEQQKDSKHQEVIEPTKSSTLDQIIATSTEVVVEPSEIVDFKDPQDSQEIESQQESATDQEIPSESSHDSVNLKENDNESELSVSEATTAKVQENATTNAPKEATTNVSEEDTASIPEAATSKVIEETAEKAPEESKPLEVENESQTEESVPQELKNSSDVVESDLIQEVSDLKVAEKPDVSSHQHQHASEIHEHESLVQITETRSDEAIEANTELPPSESMNSQNNSDDLKQEEILSEVDESTVASIQDLADENASNVAKSEPPPAIKIPDLDSQDPTPAAATTESSLFGWFSSNTEPEEPVTQSPEIQEQEPVEEVQKFSAQNAPKEDLSGGTYPDENPPEPGTFGEWFEETAKLTENNPTTKPVKNLDDVKKIPDTPSQPSLKKKDILEVEPATMAPPVNIEYETTSETSVPQESITESSVLHQELLEVEEAQPIVIQNESKPEKFEEPITVPVPDVSKDVQPTEPSPSSDPEPELTTHNEDEHEHHHHHHHHEHNKSDDGDSSSFIIVVKHLSSTLLSFLPEHLQDSILDVDDALVFTGIIALTLVSICVPYFLIEGFFSVRPLKKKVVELNKSLWKVSTAYENQQEEFEVYKKKALAYDEDKKRVEQLEYELLLLKKLESKQKEQVTSLKKELKSSAQVAEEVQSLVETTMDRKKKALEEREKLKTTVVSLKEALRRTTDELQEAQAEGSSAVMDLELARQSNETFSMKVEVLEKEVSELKSKVVSEVDRRRSIEDERDDATKSKAIVENELSELKKICHKYEETVSDLNTEISHKENELTALKETLGDDSPLVDIAEVKAKLVNAEEEVTSLQSRVESFTLENNSLSRNLKEASSSLSVVHKERDEALNRLQVLEAWFKEKEEELRKAVERYEAEKNIRGKDKDDLVRMIEEKSDESRDLNERIEALKEEFEETKQQHRNEIRALEAKSHENWLSLCQAERKAQDARKEAEFLRQTLTALTKERAENEDELNGEVPMYPLISPDMIPLPLPDDSPSYYGLGEGFIPPPPLPLDEEREPHRPAPLGRLSPNNYSDLEDSILSPIQRRRRDDNYSDEDSSASDSPRHNRRSPRGWDHRDRDDRGRRGHSGPRTSSPKARGLNL